MVPLHEDVFVKVLPFLDICDEKPWKCLNIISCKQILIDCLIKFEVITFRNRVVHSEWHRFHLGFPAQFLILVVATNINNIIVPINIWLFYTADANVHLVFYFTDKVLADGRVNVHFDGWTSHYDYLCDPRDTDLHPIGFVQFNSAKLTGGVNKTLQDPKGRFCWQWERERVWLYRMCT